ncbi:MAG: ribosomal protein S18-alanine N-acetyltransferase [Bacillota bacterium]
MEVNQNKLSVELMTAEDIEKVVEIETESFSDPWSEATFKQELYRNNYAHYLVVKKEAEVLGYVGSWIFIAQSHLTTLAIGVEYRQQGLATFLLDQLMTYLSEWGVKEISLEVRVSNQPARELYRKHGFREVGVKENYYQDNQEDAVLMYKALDEELD